MGGVEAFIPRERSGGGGNSVGYSPPTGGDASFASAGSLSGLPSEAVAIMLVLPILLVVYRLVKS